MFSHVKKGGEYEVGGFLLGGYHYYEGHRYVDIHVHVPSLKAESARTHLTFSHDAQKEFHVTAKTRYPEKLVLGWYHSHPSYSVFLSEYDLFIQRNFFSSEHHVAVVLDPYQHFRQDRCGVFVWESKDVSLGYHLIVYEIDRQETLRVKERKKKTRRTSGTKRRGADGRSRSSTRRRRKR